MRIAQVTEFFAPWSGGISEHVAHLSRALRARGHEVRILTSQFRVRTSAPLDPELEPHTYRLGPNVPFPYNGGMASVTFRPDLPRRLDALFVRESFDVVHIHNPMTPVLPLLALDRSPAVNVGTFHSYHPTERMLRWWRWVLRDRQARLSACLAVSAAARDSFSRYFDRPYDIVPNGIDVGRFAPAANGNGHGNAFGSVHGNGHGNGNGHAKGNVAANGHANGGEPAGLRLLFVGHMLPKKGLSVLLRAFEMLLDEHPSSRLEVVGAGPLGAALERGLEGRAAARVEFAGALHGSALVDRYRSCDVFCAPSVSHESFGITLLEAMAAGKPIVAARIPGYTDVVRDDREALLYDSQDPRALRDALVRLAGDVGLRDRLAAGGRDRVRAYAWSHVAATVESHYERLLRSR